nr:unnamed protein product [Callosobruchus analis]
MERKLKTGKKSENEIERKGRKTRIGGQKQLIEVIEKTRMLKEIENRARIETKGVIETRTKTGREIRVEIRIGDDVLSKDLEILVVTIIAIITAR